MKKIFSFFSTFIIIFGLTTSFIDYVLVCLWPTIIDPYTSNDLDRPKIKVKKDKERCCLTRTHDYFKQTRGRKCMATATLIFRFILRAAFIAFVLYIDHQTYMYVTDL